MKILGIEASAKAASAAIYADGQILAEKSTNGPLTHSQTLMPMIDDVMKASDTEGTTLDMIAVTNGPGSFTGLRIGAATAKGLSIGWNVPLMPLSTLEVLAWNLTGMSGLIVPVMDARRKQIYTAVYRSCENGLEALTEPDTLRADDLIEDLYARHEVCHLVGDSYVVFSAEHFEKIQEQVVTAAPHQNFLRASAACALAALKFDTGTKPSASDAFSIEYLRKPQAEREREARMKDGLRS